SQNDRVQDQRGRCGSARRSGWGLREPDHAGPGGTMTLVPKPGILDIKAYVGGRAEAPGAERVYKLSSNETPLGPSPSAITAAQQALQTVSLYPEGSARELREALGAFYGLDPARIVCGNGSDEL